MTRICTCCFSRRDRLFSAYRNIPGIGLQLKRPPIGSLHSTKWLSAFMIFLSYAVKFVLDVFDDILGLVLQVLDLIADSFFQAFQFFLGFVELVANLILDSSNLSCSLSLPSSNFSFAFFRKSMSYPPRKSNEWFDGSGLCRHRFSPHIANRYERVAVW